MEGAAKVPYLGRGVTALVLNWDIRGDPYQYVTDLYLSMPRRYCSLSSQRQ
jgi:hypothetical protein